jgi:hypothetical protein
LPTLSSCRPSGVGFYDDYDALVVAWVFDVYVLRDQLVDDVPGLVAFDPVDDSAADGGGLLPGGRRRPVRTWRMVGSSMGGAFQRGLVVRQVM